MKKILLLNLFVTVSVFCFGQNFNLEFRSQVPYAPYAGSSIWGYVDDAGSEYALVGTGFGLSIVNVDDPDNPQVLFDVVHDGTIFPGLAWREVKTWEHYAYVTNEAGNGILIVDLQYLPDTFMQYQFIYTDGQGYEQTTGHTLWIDEKGRLFVFGNNYNYGATIFDLTVDPLNPPLLGLFSETYIHDGFVRGDTLWAAEIYDGQLEIIDVSNPASPLPLASVHTPSFFTHNSWPTHDNKYVFTTDEVDGSFLTAYDVSDLSDIEEVDRIQDNPGTDVIVHNVHLLNDQFAVTAYYCDGVVLFDVSRPDNMVKVGAYDTYLGDCFEFNGSWGVYPYLPSGNIIVSNIEDGLFVLTPTYQAACWLEGSVTDSLTQTPLNGVVVDILNTTETDQSDLSGIYKTGHHAAGNYSVRYSKPGYATKILENVSLTNGIVTNLDVELLPSESITLTGIVIDSATNAPIANANLYFTDNVFYDYSVTADASGNFSIPSFLTSEYSVIGAAWSYRTKETDNIVVTSTGGPVTVKLSRGYYDDFFFDQGWTVAGDATAGIWERAEPNGTTGGGIYFNPELDVENDFGDKCFVTGNNGINVTSDQVNGGHTILSSPTMDLTIYDDPKVSYYVWFANGGGSNGGNDSMIVSISDGVTSVPVQVITKDNITTSAWNFHEFDVAQYIQPSSNMKIQFSVGDQPSSENWVEGAVDQFEVSGTIISGVAESTFNENGVFNIYPNPFSSGSVLQYHFNSGEFNKAQLKIYNMIGQLAESLELRGNHGTVQWGNNLTDGMYLVKIEVDGMVVQTLPAIKSR